MCIWRHLKISLILGIFTICLTTFSSPYPSADIINGEKIVRDAVKYYRGLASIGVVKMTIHRPNWERTMKIKIWTKGISNSLFVIIAPRKDYGNGTLKRGSQMWTYNPKVNRVIKIPPSMMAQSWMGSDFSNNDLAKSDTILTDYIHHIVRIEKDKNGKKIYVIEAIPKPEAPVVWGKQVLKIREDHILLMEEFYDEDMNLVKRLEGSHIGMLGGKLLPRRWKMEKVNKRDSYTLLEYESLKFLKDLPDRIFTISFLKSPELLR